MHHNRSRKKKHRQKLQKLYTMSHKKQTKYKRQNQLPQSNITYKKVDTHTINTLQHHLYLICKYFETVREMYPTIINKYFF